MKRRLHYRYYQYYQRITSNNLKTGPKYRNNTRKNFLLLKRQENIKFLFFAKFVSFWQKLT